MPPCGLPVLLPHSASDSFRPGRRNRTSLRGEIQFRLFQNNTLPSTAHPLLREANPPRNNQRFGSLGFGSIVQRSHVPLQHTAPGLNPAHSYVDSRSLRIWVVSHRTWSDPGDDRKLRTYPAHHVRCDSEHREGLSPFRPAAAPQSAPGGYVLHHRYKW